VHHHHFLSNFTGHSFYRVTSLITTTTNITTKRSFILILSPLSASVMKLCVIMPTPTQVLKALGPNPKYSSMTHSLIPDQPPSAKHSQKLFATPSQMPTSIPSKNPSTKPRQKPSHELIASRQLPSFANNKILVQKL
jgi:hypothetical protein